MTTLWVCVSSDEFRGSHAFRRHSGQPRKHSQLPHTRPATRLSAATCACAHTRQGVGEGGLFYKLAFGAAATLARLLSSALTAPKKGVCTCDRGSEEASSEFPTSCGARRTFPLHNPAASSCLRTTAPRWGMATRHVPQAAFLWPAVTEVVQPLQSTRCRRERPRPSLRHSSESTIPSHARDSVPSLA